MKKIKLYESDSAEVEAQRFWVFAVLMGVGGFFGAFTYSIRGGVFCNAQTANFVLFAMALGRAQWGHALYFLIPMSAYFLGAVLSEAASSTMEQLDWMRWDTLLILVEMVAVVFLGLLPESTPFAITQVVINFICSMQYNTFRKTQGIPMATTFCTNHVRQMGIFFAKAVRHRNWDHVGRLLCHLLPVVRDRRERERLIAEALEGGVRRENGRRQHGAFQPHGGEHRQRNGQRAFSDAGQVLHGDDSFHNHDSRA